MFLSILLLAVPAFGAALQNTDFDVADLQSPRFGWSAPFSVTVTNGAAVLAEDGVHLPVRLTQSFDLATNVTQIQIILEALNLGTNNAGQPPDAFQISLLDTNNVSLVPVTPQTNTTAFFSAQQDGTIHYGSATTVPGAAGSGTNWTPVFPVAITLNLTNRSSNVAAVLSFDLLGFDRVASGVVISRIRMIGLEPVAAADTAVVNEDATVNISILTNDVPGAGQALDPASLRLITPPTNGAVTAISTNGVVSYRPATNVHGMDSFTYTIADFAGNRSATTTVSVTVSPVNDAPVLDAAKSPVLSAVNEDAGAPAGTVGTLVSALVDFVTPAGELDNVAEADSGAALGLAVIGKTAAGQVWYSTNNGTTWTPVPAVSAASALLLAADTQTRLYYQPAANFNGAVSDGITFAAWDRSAGASGATGINAATRGGTTAFSETTDVVAVTVLSVNDPPAVANDTFATSEDGLLNATSVLANDSDLHGGAPGENNTPLTALLASSTANGVLVLNANGTFTYRPNTNFNGADSFTYRARDSLAGTSALATVTINVSAVNDPPVVLVPGPTNVFRMTPAALRGIALADVDSGVGGLTLALSVRNGALQLATNIPGGVTSGQVTSNGLADVFITAPLAALNATLAATNGLIYTGGFNYLGTEALTLLLNDNGHSGSGGAKSITNSMGITVTGDAKDVWRKANFTTNDLTDPAKEATVWGDAADPDRDGQPNLMEFVADTNPNSAASMLQFRIEPELGAPNRCRMRVAPGFVAGRTYTLLGSATAASGYTPIANAATQTNGAERVITDLSAPVPSVRFYRLRVSVP